MTLTLKYYENAIEKKRYKSKNILRNIPDDKKVIAAIAAVTYKMAKNKKGNQSNS